MATKKTAGTNLLREYHAKRDFSVSPEPAGKSTTVASAGPSRKSKPLSFCVQKHLASHLHYDFRLEHRGVLLSWAVPKGPSLNPKDKRLAMQVENHPLEYGQFEGVIPEGYGAGIVLLWDRGIWEPEPGFEDIDAALEKGELKLRLEGVKLKGSWVLIRTRGMRGGSARDEGRSWLLIKHRDDWAGDVDVTQVAPESVKSFGDFDDILAADNPDIWESHRPAEGGAAGKLLAQVIESAARKKAARQESKAQAPKPARKPAAGQRSKPAATKKTAKKTAGGKKKTSRKSRSA